jgi:UDP-GlcNAc:undecaprenyl-phosphate GlcNAc-1-phosphate transferase
MTEYVITLLAAAAVTYILTPAVRRFAIAVGAMHAARERDVHELPTPLLGGFAIYGGLVFALLLASRLSGLNSVFTDTNMAKGLLLAGGLVVIMGFVDDRWGMGALSKLAGQVAAGVILVWSGAEIPWLPAPGGVTLILTSDQQVAVTILVVVVTMNAVNFIDGLDGLAAGIVGIGAITCFAYYYTLVHRLGLLDQSEPALVSVMLAGVCLGFLPHNFYPARIFMGDTGSMLIGLMLAFAPISSLALLDPASLTDNAAYAAGTVNRYGAFIPLLVPAAILLIPYADLLMAVIRRTRAGKSVFAPDKKHLQHRLLAIGHSHRTSVLIMYLWAALFSGTVILLSIVRTPLFVLAIVTVAAVLVLLLVTMPRLRPWSRTSAGDGTAARPVSRPARTAPARVAPAGVAPAGVAPASAAPASAGPASAGPASAGSASAGPASAGPASTRPTGAGGAGAVPSPEPARSSAPGAAPQRASGRLAGQAAPQGEAAAVRRAATTPAAANTARRPAGQAGSTDPAGKTGSTDEAGWPPAAGSERGEVPAGNGVTDNGGGQGNGRSGNGARGNGAAAAKGRGRKGSVSNSAAGPGTPAATPQDGSPVTHAAGPDGWSLEAADTRPPSGTSSPAAGRSVPPWELPPQARSAGPPWVAGHDVPPWAAGRSVPPWELADPNATGPIPVLPWPDPAGSPAEASDVPGSGHPASPWQPAAQPWPPAAPPWPPASPPWP